MTDFLADTNVIFRWATPDDPQCTLCRLAIRRLYRKQCRVFITGQILMETWALLTRPKSANGMEYTTVEALATIRRIKRKFPLLEETSEIYPVWQGLAVRYGIVGRQVYDTRLVAVMEIHGIANILTMNGAHFRRFREIAVFAPDEIV